MFSFEHLIIFLIFTVITVAVAIFGRFLKDNHSLIIFITKILIGLTIFQETCDYLNRYFNGTLSWEVDLPLHVCQYILFLTIIALYNKNEYIFNFCYFKIKN